MTIASRCHKKLNSAVAWDQTRFNSEELSLHDRFAKAAAKGSNFNHTYKQFQTLRIECARRGLRACGFRQFCNRVNASHNYRSDFLRANTWKDHPKFWPENSRPADLKTLLLCLDHTVED